MRLQGVKGGKILAQILRAANNLAHLNVSNNQLKKDGIFKMSEALEDNRSLKELFLSSTGMGSEGAKEIAKSLRNNTTINILKISHNNIKVDGAMALAIHLKNNKTLTQLDLGFNALDGSVVQPITEAFLTEHSSLTDLSFAENKQLGKDGGMALGNMLRNSTSLKRLDLRGCGINGASGCEIAKGLAINTTLLELDLACNGLGLKGGKSILDALKVNTTLSSITIHINNLSDKLEEQFRHIKAVKKNFTESLLTTSIQQLEPEKKQLPPIESFLRSVKEEEDGEQLPSFKSSFGTTDILFRPEEELAVRGLEELQTEGFGKKRKIG
eukprot:TRINITY_DN5685_c0_g1_i2.p1 TRINITY_DN5685_c0_g1~~TRINITY_DN5685_c0_g1_i2.p1  ORF type:complete len:327 (+),score=81.45 TRINITY_DN5685_c0_g1_i2:82-1062(+)